MKDPQNRTFTICILVKSHHSKTNFLTKVLTDVLQGVTGTSGCNENPRKYLDFHKLTRGDIFQKICQVAQRLEFFLSNLQYVLSLYVWDHALKGNARIKKPSQV